MKGRQKLLHKACRRGDLEMVKKLLRAGIDKDGSDSDGDTPLNFASANGRTAVVKALLRVGADKDKGDIDGCTPLFNACLRGHSRVGEMLLRAGADIGNAKHCNPLIAACNQGHVQIAEMLLCAGADPEKETWEGKTPLFAACSDGSSEIAEVLLRAGAKKDARYHGQIALDVAIIHGHTDITKLLSREYRRDVRVIALGLNDENSPLSLLVGFGHIYHFIVAKALPHKILKHKPELL